MGINMDEKETLQPRDLEEVLHHMWSPGLAFLRAVHATEADAFSAVVVQDFERIAVKDGDDGAGWVSHSETTGAHAS